MIAARLIDRHAGVQIGKFWLSHRDHLNGGIQLHRAAAQWDHSPVQRQIAVRKAAHVARNFGLGAVEVENGMGEIGAVAQHGCGQAVGAIGLAVIFHIAAKGTPNGLNGFRAGLLIKADTDAVRVNFAQVDAIGDCGLKDDPLKIANLHGDRVKEDFRLYIKAHGFQPFGQATGFPVYGLCNGFDTVRSMIDRIHGGNHSQKRLGGTHI